MQGASPGTTDHFINRDGFDITVDTSCEGLYGYQFGLNLGGSPMDSSVLSERQFNKEWDGPLDGEFRIPGTKKVVYGQLILH